jgi:hypothetical protein
LKQRCSLPKEIEVLKVGFELFLAFLGLDAAVLLPVWISIKARKLREESELAIARQMRGQPQENTVS